MMMDTVGREWGACWTLRTNPGETTCIESTLGSSAFRFEGNVCATVLGADVSIARHVRRKDLFGLHIWSQHVPQEYKYITASEQGGIIIIIIIPLPSLRIKTAVIPRRNFPLRQPQKRKRHRLILFTRVPKGVHALAPWSHPAPQKHRRRLTLASPRHIWR